MKKITLLLLLICGGLLKAYSQSESGIKKSKVPSCIITYIDKIFFDHTSVKFYKEKDNDTLYYEAAFKMKGENYHLLFDQSGNLFETEKIIVYESLSTNIFAKTEAYFKIEFTSYKVTETQEVDQMGRLMYELKVKGKKNSKTSYYEVYFDREGNFIRREDTQLKTIPSLF